MHHSELGSNQAKYVQPPLDYFPVPGKMKVQGSFFPAPKARDLRSSGPTVERSDTRQKGQGRALSDSMNPSSLEEMSGNSKSYEDSIEGGQIQKNNS